jgi:hypothetical protein
VLSDLEDGLSELAGDAADVVEEQKAAPEQPPQPEPIKADRYPKQEPGYSGRWLNDLDNLHD